MFLCQKSRPDERGDVWTGQGHYTIMHVMGVLYVVATPIGNLEDITLRALRVLGEVHLIAAEDTRTTSKLLTRYGIQTPVRSFFEHNELDRQEDVLTVLQSCDVALVSEAGVPTVSDPGYRLVKACIDTGIRVVPIPGPSSILAALSVSGLPTDSFVFVGFLPRRRAARRTLVSDLATEPRTLICFEAPHRLLRALEDLAEVLGDRQVVVACELTKMFEEVWRGSLSGAVNYAREKTPRGEYTLVLEGAGRQRQDGWTELQVLEALNAALAAGASRRDAAQRVAAEARWPKRDVYSLAAREAEDISMDGGQNA